MITGEASSIGAVPLYLPPEERRDDPAPLRTDDRRAVLVGTGVWLALLVGTLVARDGLAATVSPGDTVVCDAIGGTVIVDYQVVMA